MTILAPTPTRQRTADLLTGFDVLDIADALRNAAARDCMSLDARDRQALALLTYWDGCPTIYRRLFERVFDGSITLPLPNGMAAHLLHLIDQMPAVSPADEHAWLAARDQDTPCVVDQIITALAGYTATRSGEDGYGLLNGAVQTAIRAGKPGMPLPEVPKAASQAIGDALADLDADGLLPEPSLSPVDRGLKIIAAHAARNPGTTTADIVRWAIAVVSAEVAHADPSPIPDSEVFAAHEEADRLVERERARMLAAEYGEVPAAVNAR